MLSFSKALSFLMAFAVTSSITTTTVQGRLLAGHDSADSSDIVTCGQCLPIMEGDEAVIGVRLYKASSAEEYLALADEIASPFFSTQPGFISYTGVQTQDPEIVMFMSIYDTVENSAAAYEKMKETIQIPLPSERLMNYYGTITWTGDDPGGDEDCVKSFDVGDYLSARMHYRPKNQSIPNTRRQARYKIFSAVESFDSYTTSKGLGEYDTDSFFFEIFNDKDDSAAANALQVSGTALDPNVELIYNVVAGQVVFDSTCSDDYPVASNNEFATEEPTSVDAACKCIGAQADVSKVLEDKGLPTDLGAYCQTWELTVGNNKEACSKDGAHYGAPWCTKPWCYVGADSTCDDLAKTVAFADTSVGDTLQSSVSACSIDTCGQCLPIMEGDDAAIGVRLYKTSLPMEEYLALIEEVFSPFLSTQPGFISYTIVQTQDPEIFMFMSIYDTVENSAAAWDKSNEIVYVANTDDDELLMKYYGTITWTGDDPGGDEDCVKAFDVGDYVSARMHTRGDKKKPGIALTGGIYEVFSAEESFDSYTASIGVGEYDNISFFFEIFNDKDDSAAANALQVSGTALDPNVELIYNVVAGQVVFDSSCSDDYPVAGDDDFATEEPTSEESIEESSEESSEEPTSEESSEESSECESVADTICASDDHQVLCGLFQKYDTMFATWLSSSEGGNYDWIVFAPNDDAFSSSKTMQKLLEDTLDDADVRNVLEFHAASVEDNTTISAASSCGAKLNMFNGDDSRTKCKNGNIYQTGTGNLPGNHDDEDDRSPIGPQVINPDDPILACNGIIYVLDGVMLPKLPRSA